MTLTRLAEALESTPNTDGLRTAATVVLLRDGAAGTEVLMMRRPDTGSFAGAWVFPGGMVEPEDGPGGDDPATLVAAARRETAEETGLHVSAAALAALSGWVPPVGIPKRVLTWFFVGVPDDGVLVPQDGEVAQLQWIRPADMLASHASGEATLVPPTFVTLTALGERSIADIVAATETTPVRIFRTRARTGSAGFVPVWQGDAEYDEDVPGATGPWHRIVTDTLPWRYDDSGATN